MMKVPILMIILTITVYISTLTECVETDQNSISIENLNEDNLVQHSSRIERRSLVRIFGLKPRYRRPIQISLNWGKSNQQRFIAPNYNNHFYQKTIFNTIPNRFQVQKNFIFYNGLNGAYNQQNSQINTSTTPKYSTTTGIAFENESTKPTKSTIIPTARLDTSTEAVTLSRGPSTQSIRNTKTTQIYQPTTSSTTSKPRMEKPIIDRTTIAPTDSNDLSTKSSKGGFTSTSMPQNNEYSELIYDIDPRYRKK